MKKILLNTVFSLAILNCWALETGEVREAIVRIETSPEQLININSKHTNIKISTWKSDEVEVIATVIFDGSSNNRMDTFLENFEEIVKDKISSSGTEIYINANLDEPNKVQIGTKYLGVQIGYDDDELRVTYEINVPEINPIKVKNSYKDITMTGSFSKAEIEHYSGDLIADDFDDLKLDMKYGSARFSSAKEATMKLYEQDLEAGYIGVLNLESKYSELTITSVDKLVLTSYEDQIEIERLGEMEGQLKYGDLEFTESLGTAELNLYEVDIEAGQIESIRLIESKYSKIEADEIYRLQLDNSYEDEIVSSRIDMFRGKSKYGEYDIGELNNSFIIDGYEDDIEIDAITQNSKEIKIEGKYMDLSLETGGIPFKLLADTKYGNIEYPESMMRTKKYIKDNDKLDVELVSQNALENAMVISLTGYEIKARIK